jgi:hypothetical protein
VSIRDFGRNVHDAKMIVGIHGVTGLAHCQISEVVVRSSLQID